MQIPQLKLVSSGLTLLLLVCAPSVSCGVTISLDSLTLIDAADPINVLTAEVDGGRIFGSDTQQTVLRGTATAELELDISSGRSPVPTGISFLGGNVQASDVAFRFLGGLVTVSLKDMVGWPNTPSPPGSILDGSFDAAQHEIVIDQGTLGAAGITIDLSEDPVMASGEGTGSVVLTQLGAPENDVVTYGLELSLPVVAMDTFVIENVPLFGDVDIDILATGTVVATDQFTLSMKPPADLQAGDANQDLSFDQLDIVQISIFNKYRTGLPATWGEGDWNGAPGPAQGNPPVGDGLFDELDIIASLRTGLYLTGPYAASPGSHLTVDLKAPGLADAAVPEPSTLVLALVGMLLAVGSRAVSVGYAARVP